MSYTRVILIVGILSSVLIGTQAFAKQAPASATQNIKQIEQMAGIRTIGHEDYIPYEVILSELSSSCQRSDINLGQNKYNTFIANPNNSSYFGNKSKVRKMLKFNAIRNLIIRASSKDENTLCTQKYFLYQVLQKIQEPDPFSYPFSIQNNSSWLSSDDMVFSDLAQVYIQDRMQRLVKEGIMEASDLAHLDNKIIINYVQQCGNVHGSYHMMVSPNGQQTVSKIVINMNVCTTENYLTHFKKYVDQLFVHELAHYLYYFKDDTSRTFENICRKNNRNICNSEDFVTKYAQSSKEEDYAESFSYWYLMIHQGGKRIPNSSDIPHLIVPARIARKTEYFWTVFTIV